jgi:hypothetical protein
MNLYKDAVFNKKVPVRSIHSKKREKNQRIFTLEQSKVGAMHAQRSFVFA